MDNPEILATLGTQDTGQSHTPLLKKRETKVDFTLK
jgi:hypothetical protein